MAEREELSDTAPDTVMLPTPANDGGSRTTRLPLLSETGFHKKPPAGPEPLPPEEEELVTAGLLLELLEFPEEDEEEEEELLEEAGAAAAA
jgi:hypothetical protein